MPLRSILFAPGNQLRKAEKALTLPADLVCIDLEDAVATSEKDVARATIGTLLDAPATRPFFVRINAIESDHCFDDVEAIARPGLAGVILPMVEGASELFTIGWLLTQLERRRKLKPIEILPVIETSRGLLRLDAICEATPRVRRLSFGSWDFTLDSGIVYDPQDEDSIADARRRVVLHSRAAGLAAPIDTSYPVIGDIEGLKRSCRLARIMGYGGKACLHPEQVGPVNEAFSLPADELAQARLIVSAFEEAEREGSASIKVEGRFVDYPIYKKAKGLLAQAEDHAIGREGGS